MIVSEMRLDIADDFCIDAFLEEIFENANKWQVNTALDLEAS